MEGKVNHQDLRLGNYVMYEGCLLRVKGITESSITIDNFYGIVSLDSPELEPIPLTDDVLLKCGFEIRFFNQQSDKPLFWKVEDNRHIDIYPHSEYNFYFMINSMQMSTPLLYLHQLQNLYYSLTCQELKINL